MNPTVRQTLQSLIAPALLCLAVLPVVGHAASTKGSGKVATETRNVAEFQAVLLKGSVDLVVKQGPQSVQVEGDDNLLAMIETAVESTGQGPTLVIRMKRGQSFYTRSKLVVNVSVPKLSGVSAEGSGDIRIDAFNTPSLKVSLSGSGDAKLQGLTTADLGISIAGSGDVTGSGSAAKLKVTIAGSGDVRLAEMKADDVSINIAGSGDAAVNASKTLDVSIAGSGDVTYSGNPAVKSSVAGSGGVSRR
jgi:carbon monoxide dehydrogenase subunit G